jgi:hypothetical protein
MKKYQILLLVLLIVSLTNAQNKITLENNQFKINILSPGLSYECKLTDKTTISSELNTSFGYHFDSFNGGKILIAPYIKEQYRYYYNLDGRNVKGKKTTGNSGNFIALSTSYYFKPFNNSNPNALSTYDGFTIAPIWGLQRTYNSGLNISINTGLGYNFGSTKSNSGIKPVLNFTLGWVIGK